MGLRGIIENMSGNSHLKIDEPMQRPRPRRDKRSVDCGETPHQFPLGSFGIRREHNHKKEAEHHSPHTLKVFLYSGTKTAGCIAVQAVPVTIASRLRTEFLFERSERRKPQDTGRPETAIENMQPHFQCATIRSAQHHRAGDPPSEIALEGRQTSRRSRRRSGATERKTMSRVQPAVLAVFLILYS